jgi:GTP cyclohydrolase I
MPHPIHHLKAALIDVLGMSIDDDDGLRDTPERIYRMWEEFTRSFNPEDVMKTFPSLSDSLVIQTQIPFRGLCEHHFLPFFGHATIGYIPHGRVIGLSKLTRLVKGLGMRRPNIQETLTEEIASTLNQGIKPEGVIVVVSAEHTCMTVRGIQAPGVQTVTSALRGIFKDDEALRAEFFDLTRLHTHT